MEVPEHIRVAVRDVIAGSSAHSIESAVLDFKQVDRDLGKALTDLAEAAMCFANADGGHLVVGVADRPGGVDALKGVTASVTDVRKGIFERTSPNLVVDVVEYRPPEAADVRLIVIGVRRGSQVYSVAGRVTMRMGTDCKALSPVEVHRLYSSRQGLDITAEPTDLGPGDVSPAAMDIVRRRLRAMPEAGREIADLPVAELLRNLKLLDDQGRLRRAGALLLTESRGDEAQLVYVHRTRSSAEPDFSIRLTGGVLEVAERALELVRARRRERNLLLRSGQQITVADFPELAVREAVANALVHRDYGVHGHVFVEHDDEQLVVTSPGGFVDGVSPATVLTGEPRARNPLLAEASRNLRLGERLGVGVDRMYRSMIEAGGDPPTFEDTDDSVRVRLSAANNTDIARFVAQLPLTASDDHETDVLLVLHELCQRRTIDAAALAPIVQRQAADAQAVLARMAASPFDLLEPTRQSANRTQPDYRLRSTALSQLGSAVRYHRRTGDDIDRKVIAHVAEYGRVTNATVRNLLDVSVTRASAILRDLVDRQLLVKTSEQQRGTSVEYGPGPAFNAPRVRTARSRPPKQSDGQQRLIDEAE